MLGWWKKEEKFYNVEKNQNPFHKPWALNHNVSKQKLYHYIAMFAKHILILGYKYLTYICKHKQSFFLDIVECFHIPP